MPTLQFSNGKTVQFSAMPTQAEIDQLGQQMGIHNPAPAHSSPFAPGGDQFTQPTPQGATKMQYAPGSGTTTASKFAGSVIPAVGQLAKGVAKPFAQTGVSLYNAGVAGKDLVQSHGKPSMQATQDLNQPRTLPLVGKTEPFSSDPSHPLQGTLQAAGAGFEMAGTVEGVKSLAEPALNAVKKIPELISKVDVRLGGEAAQKALISAQKQATQRAVEAVNPDLSGKKLTSAYKDVVTGKRTITSGGVLKGQEVSTNQPTVDLGTRLKDVLTSKDPGKNLQSLRNALQGTENELTPLLENDKTPIVKRGLTDTLENLKTKMPREFKAIRDSKSAFEDVVDFAKGLVNNSEPNIKGLRVNRTAFDTQAKLEYPNAYKDGTIDIKTPAGRAIKAVRDNWNDYLYNTAEEGSKIKQLIGREADIFKATDNIAPKAAAGQGKNAITKFIKNNPKTAKAAGTVAALTTAGAVAKKFGVLP